MAQEFSPADLNRAIIEEFRANAGRVGGAFEGAALVLLTTTGRRSGRRHTTPLTYLDGGDRLLVFASNAGSDRDPAWYANVLAHPRVTVEIGAGGGVEAYDAVALAVRGEERDRLYAEQSALVPAYAEYQRMTARTIPVMSLRRAAAGDGPAIGDELVRIHETLRRDLASLREEAEAYLGGGAATARRPDLAEQLRARCLGFCDVLGEHHGNEETRGFPLLERHYPELAPVLDRLRREHTAVTGMKNELAALFAGIGTADPGRVRAELDRVTAGLEAHYAYEEAELVTALNALRL
ncbi:nitroreductase/quinone reductase family protein [Spirillospora sp. NPDC029432]|uniref:nitroreductase/quinone reductase family protein n=1 Tax=Spirillospora sp. NPDC029432 TaxID=3154599 RepID=UPI00345208B4